MAQAIRRKVFVEEQHCPADIEYSHEDESTNFLALWDGEPCGAARWRQTENGFKLERFAVLPSYRNKNVGAALLKAVLADLPKMDQKIYLNAQVGAINFYLRHDFEPVGERFEEAGIMHQQMNFVSGIQN